MLGLDPFAQINEEEEVADDDGIEVKDYLAKDKSSDFLTGEEAIDVADDKEENDEFSAMLDGGLHLMNRGPSGGKKGQDCMKEVADQCMDLNQFISKMDELV